jgi:hypothetical protein
MRARLTSCRDMARAVADAQGRDEELAVLRARVAELEARLESARARPAGTHSAGRVSTGIRRWHSCTPGPNFARDRHGDLLHRESMMAERVSGSLQGHGRFSLRLMQERAVPHSLAAA